jgi:hypothetical protein
MKTSTSETIVSLFGTMIFLFFLVPFFIIWIPYEILSASGNDIVLKQWGISVCWFSVYCLGGCCLYLVFRQFCILCQGNADTFHANQRTCCNWAIQICKKSFVHSWNARISRRDVAVSIYRYLHLYPYHVRRFPCPCSH